MESLRIIWTGLKMRMRHGTNGRMAEYGSSFFRNWIFQRQKIQRKNDKQITDRIDSIQKWHLQEKIFCKESLTNVCSGAIM